MVGRLRMLGLCGRRLEIGGQRRKERDGGGRGGREVELRTQLVRARWCA